MVPKLAGELDFISEKTEKQNFTSTVGNIDDKFASDIDISIRNWYSMSCNSAKFDLPEMLDPIRLAAVGNRYPYHTSTQGAVLYRKRNSERDGFLILYWSVLSSFQGIEKENQQQAKESQQNSANRLVLCTEEEAFNFLYSLYGSNRNSDVTDEEIDYILKTYFPNKSITG